MLKRSRKLPRDPNARAAEIVKRATDETEPGEYAEKKNPHAVALGRLGGKKGGKARAESLTKKERVDAARKAAEARWSRTESVGSD